MNSQNGNEMKQHIDSYLMAIRRSYIGWGGTLNQSDNGVRQAMNKEFCDALTTSEGNKYIKVITGPQRSVHSFIVKHDGPKFKRGDILKAASWNAPALNFARGNVVAGLYANVTWTGA